jgi:hypothetical protein
MDKYMNKIKSQIITQTHIAKFVVGLCSAALLVLGSGCSTMKITPLTTGKADSYTPHEQKNGVVVGIHPMTDKREIEAMFKVNLLDKGLWPILVVVENQSAGESFIVAQNKVAVLNMATGARTPSQRKKVTSDAGEAMQASGAIMVSLGGFVLPLLLIGLPIECTGMQHASDASVIEYNLGDKEFYSRSIGPGEKAQGFVYLQFSNASPAASNYHVVAEVRNSATGESTTFDLPASLTPPKS